VVVLRVRVRVSVGWRVLRAVVVAAR
jgi:hypothetical protein